MVKEKGALERAPCEVRPGALGALNLVCWFARGYDQIDTCSFLSFLWLAGAEDAADLDRGPFLQQVFGNRGVLGAGLGEHHHVHEERGGTGSEVVSEGEAGDFASLAVEVAGISGEAASEVEAVCGFHDI